MYTVLLIVTVILLTIGFLTAVNFVTASIIWRPSSRLNVRMARRLAVQKAIWLNAQTARRVDAANRKKAKQLKHHH